MPFDIVTLSEWNKGILKSIHVKARDNRHPTFPTLILSKGINIINIYYKEIIRK